MKNPDSSPLFSTGKDRKNVIAESEKIVSDLMSDGKKGVYRQYGWLDSSIDGNSGDSSFQGTFKEVMPAGEKSMRSYIERTLAERKGEAIGMEFGGVGSQAFGEFTKGFFKKSAGITLADYREELDIFPEGSKDKISADQERNHTVIEGNILSKEAYDAIQTWLKGKKADFIVERMAGGLESVPAEPYTVSKVLEIWYGLLREGGLMFVQVPTALNPLLESWVDMIHRDYENILEIAYAKGAGNHPGLGPVFRLRKLPGAPEELPLLDPRTVRSISKPSTSLY